MERVTDPVEAVLETLISRGWRFRDPDQIRDLIRSKANSASSSSSSSSYSLDSVEPELLKMDLRSIGGKSLADPSAMKKLSHLQGPKILQLVSIRDIYQNSIDSSFKNSQNHRRLLRFILTDGHSEITAIEYAPIPSINEEIVPGTKVRLDNKILVHSGILCLNPKVVTVMGGVVQSLYEEWQMSQKYSGISRSNLRRSQNDDNVGPPPFEKLQVEAQSYHESMPHGSHGQPGSSSKISSHMSGKTYGRHMGRYEEHKATSGGSHLNDGSKMIPSTKNIEENPSTSEARPKEVSEAVPVQNQAAAQKLLQKLSQSTHHPRSQKHRLRDKQEEAHVFTLDEWERRKASTLKHSAVDEARDVSCDEELARQLQNQLDLEDFHARTGNAEAEQIRMNMFSYTGEEDKRNEGGRGFRGRGRGRGRGRRRFG